MNIINRMKRNRMRATVIWQTPIMAIIFAVGITIGTVCPIYVLWIYMVGSTLLFPFALGARNRKEWVGWGSVILIFWLVLILAMSIAKPIAKHHVNGPELVARLSNMKWF